MQPFIQFCKVSAYSSVYYTTVLYKYIYLQKHSSCANLLLFLKMYQYPPFLPIPRSIFKACIKINFGVGKLLCAATYSIFSIYICTKVDQFTEPYRGVHVKIHNAVVRVAGSQETKEGFRYWKGNTQRIPRCSKKEPRERKKSKENELAWAANYYTEFSRDRFDKLSSVRASCGPRRSSLAFCLARYFQMYNATVSKCFWQKRS